MIHQLISDYESVDEVKRTSPQFVVETVRDEPNPLNDFELETLLEITKSES